MTVDLTPLKKSQSTLDELRSSFKSLALPNTSAIPSFITLAEQEFSSGNTGTALIILENLARMFPVDLLILGSLASVQATLGNIQTSIVTLRRAIIVIPNDAMLVNNFAAVLQQEGLDESVGTALVRRAVLAGTDAGWWFQLGEYWARRKLPARASVAFQRSNALAPLDKTRKALIQVLLDASNKYAAIRVMEELESLDEKLFIAYCNTCIDLGAFATLERGMAGMLLKAPGNENLSELAMGHLWRFRGCRERERACLESARRDERSFAPADSELLAHIARNGTEQEIIVAFAERMQWRDVPVTDHCSNIRIDNIRDVHTLDPDDGFNISVDIVFSRFLRRHHFDMSETRLHVDARALSLFRRSFRDLEVRSYAVGTDKLHLEPKDLHVRELAYVTRESAPPQDLEPGPLLRVDPNRFDAAKRRYKSFAHDRPVVGLCWRSSGFNNRGFESSERMLDMNGNSFDSYIANSRSFWRKCVPLLFFAPIISDRDLHVVSMQYGLADWEVNQLEDHRVYQDLAVNPLNHFGNLDEIAAEIAALDAFITIPCGYAHLAAALGVPTYVLLNDVSVIYWDWHRRFPFYPNANLIVKPPVWSGGDMIERKYWGNWSPQIAKAHEQIRSSLGLCSRDV
jgi:Tfp pilus assembly protein PilF